MGLHLVVWLVTTALLLALTVRVFKTPVTSYQTLSKISKSATIILAVFFGLNVAYGGYKVFTGQVQLTGSAYHQLADSFYNEDSNGYDDNSGYDDSDSEYKEPPSTRRASMVDVDDDDDFDSTAYTDRMRSKLGNMYDQAAEYGDNMRSRLGPYDPDNDLSSDATTFFSKGRHHARRFSDRVRRYRK